MQIEKEGSVVIVTFDEEINMELSLEIEEKIKGLVRNGERNIVFDLAKTNDLPSIAIRIFTSTVREVNTLDGKLKIANMNNSIKRLFKSINLLDILNVHKSVKDAINDF